VVEALEVTLRPGDESDLADALAEDAVGDASGGGGGPDVDDLPGGGVPSADEE
jgi:hypothetical protein